MLLIQKCKKEKLMFAYSHRSPRVENTGTGVLIAADGLNTEDPDGTDDSDN